MRVLLPVVTRAATATASAAPLIPAPLPFGAPVNRAQDDVAHCAGSGLECAFHVAEEPGRGVLAGKIQALGVRGDLVLRHCSHLTTCGDRVAGFDERFDHP